MLRKPAYDWPVIRADELRDARLRAGYTSQAALAEALNVSLRTVTAWEAEGGHVSPRAEAKVRALLWPAPGPLSSYSNYELLSEIGRRLDAGLRPRPDGDPPNGSQNFGERENVSEPRQDEGWQIGYGVAGQPEQ